MHSRLLSLRSGAALLLSTLLVLVAFEPASAEPAPAPSAEVAPSAEPSEPSSPEPEPEQPAPEVEEQPSAPAQDAPSEQAPILGSLQAQEVHDDAISDLVTVEEVEVPEATAQALSATDDSIVEKVDLQPFNMAAVSWDPDADLTGVEIVMSVRVGGEWTDWETLTVADGEGDPSASDPLWTAEAADGVRARATSADGPLPGLKITTVDPGEQEAVDTPAVYQRGEGGGFSSTAVARPGIISRAGWGAGPGTSCDATRGTMRSVVIHHTAGANSYTKAQSAGIVRSYQTMHIRTNGWCDIGYNFLVDKYGQIFEGRAGSIAGHRRGAHAGVGTVNDNSTGIAMMGNFETANIWNGEWNTLRSTVSQLTAWRLQSFGLKPLTRVTLGGRTNFTVNGHRDWMATACPGRYGLDWLNAGNGLRADVDKLLASGSTPKPTPPVAGLKASNVQTDRLTLAWNAYPGAARYRVYYSTSSSMPEACGSNCRVVTVSNPNAPSTTLTGLPPGSTQHLKVSAINSAGKTITGWQAQPLTVKLPANIPRAVEGVAATPNSPDSLSVTWKAVPTAVRYRVYYTTSSSMPEACGANCQVVTPSNLSSPQTTLSKLVPGSTYNIKVSAIDASGKTITGWQEKPVTVAAKAPVAGLSLSNVKSNAFRLSWKAVPTAVRYRIYYMESASMPEECGANCRVVTPASLSSPSTDVSGLKPGATYYVKISAINAAGRTVTTWQPVPLRVGLDSSIPSAVKGLASSGVTNNSVDVSWDPVPSATRYRIYYTTSSSMPEACAPHCTLVTPGNLNSPSTSLKGLEPGATYNIKVSALNAAGKTITGWQAQPMRVKIDRPVQSARVSSIADDAATVSWARVPTAVRYRVYYTTTPSMPEACGANCTVITPQSQTMPSTRLTNLRPGTAYYLKVSAINSAGKTITSWQQEPVQFRTTGSIPTSVQDVKATASGRDSVQVSWRAVSSATRYRVYYTTTPSMPGACGKNCQVITPSNLKAPSTTLRNLDPGATYYIKVSAINAAGETITQWQTQPVTVALKRPVTGLRTSNVGTTQFDLSWDPVPTATRYRIYRMPNPDMPEACGSNCYLVTPTDRSKPSTRVSGLPSGVTHSVKVSAVNAAGETITSWQTAPLVVPLAGTVPSAVAGVAVSQPTQTGAQLGWRPVPGAVRYRVYVSSSASMPSACAPNCHIVVPKSYAAPTTQLSGLTANTTYYVKVSAIDAAGKTITGWQSSPVSFRTTGGSSNSATFSNNAVTMKGHGYGHGVGMSQYGAQGGALAGRSFQQILSHYYPGTTLATRSSNIRVQISGAPTDALTVRPKSGLMVQSAGGGPNMVLPARPDGRHVDLWQVVRAGDTSRNQLRYNTGGRWYNHGGTWRGDVQFGVDSGTVTALFGANDRTFRGVIRWWTGAGSARTTVNELFSLDDYIRGVVPREMPSSWHQQALRSQAVAARTYSLRTMNPGRADYDICDTTACQVYGAVAAETAATNTAIDATRGQVLMYNGTPAFTQYSSSSGGYTNWPSYPKDHPYLKPVKDDWDAVQGNANHSWTVTLRAETVTRAYPQIGTPRSIQVTARNGYGDMGGRVEKVRITGSSGSVEVTGNGARTAFGLKSNWFGF